jgi:hypothetical protein
VSLQEIVSMKNILILETVILSKNPVHQISSYDLILNFVHAFCLPEMKVEVHDTKPPSWHKDCTNKVTKATVKAKQVPMER